LSAPATRTCFGFASTPQFPSSRIATLS
jgi:hypothetical protein